MEWIVLDKVILTILDVEQVEGYNVAYVGNIAFEAGESDLRELLAGCEITKVRRHTDKDTGKFKGYAHVHFADEESLDR